MDEVNVVCLLVGRCLDACSVLLDLLIRTSMLLLRFLSDVSFSLHGTLVDFWNCALFSFLTATEAISSTAHGALEVVDGWLQIMGGVFEGFKMVGHLICHVAWRTKDVLHRGLISGSCIVRQTCEGICIVLSLVLYFVNTLVNVALISTQNCLTVVASIWEAVADPVHRLVELALTLLTFLYSCLVGATVLLWTSCQLLLDFLGALGCGFITVFTFDPLGLLIAAAIVLVTLLFLNLRLRVLAGQLSFRLVRALLGAGSIQATIHGLYTAALESALVRQVDHTRTVQHMSPTGLPQTGTGGFLSENQLPLNELSNPDSVSLPARQKTLNSSSKRAGMSAPTDGELLSLLKEQEERKKCVICQDLTKTVLLLPCRHLCLCRHCANILTQQQPIQQRCCPLCRQNITQTMDVFL
ncbi:E3 ubiquitin-protein ligase RNF26 [Channa argus]|uniref:E3 ubiquitin-protein ligase RNF26 n=1 Tax=Channa argus TaxID=215402 RepID=A0A6G1QSG4_CHAAH|nr:E3 ubiquitin-protein ligase RNF26 [Channa argus]